MAKKLLALFDRDLDYVSRFMNFVKGRRNLPFKVAGFSETGSLFEFVERNRVDILLYSDNNGNEHLSELKKVLGIGEIIILGEKKNVNSGSKVINKYQSAEVIIDEILESLQLDNFDGGETNSENLEIITVYSPSCDQRKQTFSLCLANAASKNKAVLYINLERFSGLKSMLYTEKDISISEIIYFYSTNTSKIREGLSSSTVAIGNFDCLTAPLDIEDLDIIGEENWLVFLKMLASLGGYDCVVVDLDEAIKRINNFFEISRRIYVPTISGLPAERKLAEFKDYLKLCGRERLLEKICEVNVGETGAETNLPAGANPNYLQNCFMGRMQVIADRAYSKGVKDGA